MEIKCKVSFALPDELMKALDLNEDTAAISYIENGRVVVEIVDGDENFDDDDDYTEDDFDNEDDDCVDGECDCCEYYCPHCGKCVLD